MHITITREGSTDTHSNTQPSEMQNNKQGHHHNMNNTHTHAAQHTQHHNSRRGGRGVRRGEATDGQTQTTSHTTQHTNQKHHEAPIRRGTTCRAHRSGSRHISTLTFCTASMSAPASNSFSHMAEWPFHAARISGVS